MPKDFLEDVLRMFAEAAPNLAPTDVVRIEQRIRQVWGGDRVYICKAAAEGKALRLGDELAAGVPISQAMANAGLKRATGYRLLSRRWRVR